MQISERDIQTIVDAVLKNINDKLNEKPTRVNRNQQTVTPMKLKTIVGTRESNFPGAVEQESGDFGVFKDMEAAIAASDRAQKEFVKNFQLKDREKIISAIRKTVLEHKEELARRVYEETKIGRYADKVAKHELVALKTPGTEDLQTLAHSGDDGLTIIEQAPFGLIGAITPVTNPTETIINNAIGMLAAGNAVVFNVHPSSKQSCAYAVKLLNQAIIAAGGPENLVTMVQEPTMDTLQQLIDSPKVKLLVGTGGVGLVRTLLKSGKKVIGAGAGNPPVIVDDTADIEQAAKLIIEGASFDNNLLCIAEKEVFAFNSIFDELVFQMLNNGAYMLSQQQLTELMSFALEENHERRSRGCSLDTRRKYRVSKQWVGKDAAMFLERLGVQTEQEVKLLICEVDFDHPFVQLEQMMPVLPLVRVNSLDEAIDLAVKAEHGNRHTAVMHSKNVDHLTRFARAIDTTIFVKNASSLAGVGYGGEGHTTMTIAGPTGEGITSARTFTRQRRCVLAEGGFRIIG